MPRPKLFKLGRRALNVYLHPEQKEWLTRHAAQERRSPSAIVRDWIEREMKMRGARA